jgi:predicted  nucleic acid-binding Zn-ribbon protein
MNKVRMEFKRLVIIGIDREYCCEFKPGLNIIWGDLDSGKSSILNLIDFALGAKFGDLDNDEITAYGRSVCLELSLNGREICLFRVLGEKVNLIKVYNCIYSNINEHYPLLCSASPDGKEPDGWISNLLLDYLEIPKVRLKQSKYRDDSDSSRLSFRDLIKLIHLKQKSVASDNLMNLANGIIFNRNVEVQKFIYGVHDDQISELNQQITDESIELGTLRNQTKSVDTFLQATDSKINYDDDVSQLHEEQDAVDEEIKFLKNDSDYSSATSRRITSELKELSKNIHAKEKHRNSEKEKLVDYARLKASYEKDLNCISDSIMIREHLYGHELSHKEVSCPTCNGAIKLADEVLTMEELLHEQRSLKNRLAGCIKAINKIKNDIVIMDQEISNSTDNFEYIRSDFEKNNLDVLSPIIEMISKAETIRRSLSIKLVELKKNQKLVKKLDEMYLRIESKEIHVKKLKTELEKIESQLLSTEDIIDDLSKYYNELMRESKLTRAYGSSIDNKFMPMFRKRSYSKNSSGGVRTLMSVYLYIARLKYLLKNGGYLPTTLLLDTPGQNIGKYAREGDDSSLSDPAVYEQIYKALIDLNEENSEENYQIIVVDNDLATCLNKSDYFLVKRFDKTEMHGEKGLINNATLPEKL